MKNTKQSITLKVILGYLLIATLAGLAVWFIYNQVLGYTSMAESNITSNEKLYLVGDAATNLYQIESLGRQVILTGDTVVFSRYNAEIDSVKFTLRTLRETYTDTILKKEVDSINFLLAQKTNNLVELLELREQKSDQSYYARAISELKKADPNFEDSKYEGRFLELKPYQRDILIKLLQYSEEENNEITEETIDSMVTSVKNVLTQLEAADLRYQNTLRAKENALLANEISLNGQLRNLLSTIEEQERKSSLAQVSAAQKMVKSTSQIIAVLAAISLLVIFIFLFLVIKDVTKSQRYRNELESAKQYAEKILKSKEQFMATVTHDLRSPLNTVVGYTDLLEKSDLSTSQSHYLNHLKKSSDFILRLVNDLLDLSKLEAGRMLVEKLPFNPKNLIEDTIENIVPSIKPEKVIVEVNLSKSLNQRIICDPFRIKQILINLVVNACKFTDKGEVKISGELIEKNKKPVLIIVVKDTGIGISKEKKEAVFEEFSQEDSSIEKRFGGSGLGLAITKKLTELLHGSIDLQSEPGKGSEFTLKIPVAYAENSEKIHNKETSSNKGIKGKKVLIVDDDSSQIALLKELLENVGMKIEIANNGKEAVFNLKQKKYALVLTDIQMPKMDGFELLSYIRNNSDTERLPVIALSGKPDTSSQEYQKLGFSASLLKPYSPVDLLEVIQKALQLKPEKHPILEQLNLESNEDYTLADIKLFSGDDHLAMGTILTAFIDSTRTNLKALKKANSEQEKDQVSAISHKMLPMFRQLKATNIVKQLAKLETGKKTQIESVDFERLSKEILQLLDTLGQEIKT